MHKSCARYGSTTFPYSGRSAGERCGSLEQGWLGCRLDVKYHPSVEHYSACADKAAHKPRQLCVAASQDHLGMFPTPHDIWSPRAKTHFHGKAAVRCYASKASRDKHDLISDFDVNDPRLISLANALEVTPSELQTTVFSTPYNINRFYSAMLNGDHQALAATAKHLQQLLGLGSKQQLLGVVKLAPQLLSLPHHVVRDRFEQFGIITGFDKEACRTIICIEPGLLSKDTGTLRTKIHGIRQLLTGDDTTQLQHVLRKSPSLLNHTSSNLAGHAHSLAALLDVDFRQMAEKVLNRPLLLNYASETLRSKISALSKGLQLDDSTVKHMCYTQPGLLEGKPETIISKVRKLQQLLKWQPALMNKVLEKCPVLFTNNPNTIATRWQLLQTCSTAYPAWSEELQHMQCQAQLSRWLIVGWNCYAVLQYLADCAAKGVPHTGLPSMATVLTPGRKHHETVVKALPAFAPWYKRHWPDLEPKWGARRTGKRTGNAG
eukprot:jgi/Chrzof1/6618/Cz19g02250.t1